MNTFNFTAIISKGHLFKLMAMYQTLKVHCRDFRLFVLCVDQEAYTVLSKMNDEYMAPVNLMDIEDEELLTAKLNRNFREYCWTLKPFFLDYIMENKRSYYYAHLDADLCFYSNPTFIFEENPQASVFLTHHRNSKMFESWYKKSGLFNTGFVGCQNDRIGQIAIKSWKEDCLARCSNETYGDQRHVEKWPHILENVHVVNTVGANAAMWNIQSYTVSERNRMVILNEEPLIFYHFSGFTIISEKEFNLCYFYFIKDKNTVNLIYRPYMMLLHDVIKKTRNRFPWFNYGFTRKAPKKHRYILY